MSHYLLAALSVFACLQLTALAYEPESGSVAIQQTPNIEILRGRDGRDGLPGRDGRDGEQGPMGPRGSPGTAGTPQCIGPIRDPAPKSGGVVYTRWGKLTCRNGADLVYAGRMAGSNHLQAGGGTTRLCMPPDPEYTLPFINGVQSYSPLTVVEYQNTVKSFQHDIPCAVCIVPTKELVLMIPAKTSCPASFTREYYGYLMSERVHPVHHRSTFECVDKDLGSVPGSSNAIRHAWFGHVEAVCNALPCPPYNNYKEINCVVCTK